MIDKNVIHRWYYYIDKKTIEYIGGIINWVQ